MSELTFQNQRIQINFSSESRALLATIPGLVDAAIEEEIATGFTQGSIVFRGPANFDEDNANLFWDDTNNRLGIGIAVPTRSIHVFGKGLFQNTGTNADVIFDRTNGKIGLLGAAGSSVTLSYDNTGIFKIESNSRAMIELGNIGTGATTRFEIDANGYVKIPNLGNYADDTAASAGGVPINGFYRNGSVVMVRVS